MRDAEHVRAIRAGVTAFGEQAEHLVFVGGCTLGLYARAEGPPLRTTEDVDCISSLSPWGLQAKMLADLCQAGVIVPDDFLQCRDADTVRAVTPPYFLATKLVAFADRGPDAQSSKDAEDIVALAVEVPSLLDEVEAEGLLDDVAALWDRVFDKYGLTRSDLADFVAWHLDRRDAAHRDRVTAVPAHLAGASRTTPPAPAPKGR